MVSKAIKQGSWFINAMGIYLIVLSILWITVTEIMFISDFQAYTGTSYADYYLENQAVATMYIMTKKLIGVMLLALGLITVIINKKAYVKGEAWAWKTILLIGLLTWGTMITYKLIINYIGASMMTFVTGAALTAIGLIIPSKEILKK